MFNLPGNEWPEPSPSTGGEPATDSAGRPDEINLPRPMCTYADHSYPAYSAKQVREIIQADRAARETAPVACELDVEADRAEGAALLAALFKILSLKKKNSVRPEFAERLGRFMFKNGYRVVFNNWHLQAEPDAPTAVQATAESAPASAAPDEQWISVEDRLPEHACLASYQPHFRGHGPRVIRAVYFKQYQVQASGEDGESTEYNEADDTEYIKAGWYERIDNWGDFSSVAVCEGEVTHWMPLPAAPSNSSPVGAKESK